MTSKTENPKTHAKKTLQYVTGLIGNEPDNKEGIEGDTELVIVDVGDVLDVDPNADQCLVILIGKIEFRIVCRNAN